MENSWTITENPIWTSHRKIMKSSCLGRLKKRKIHGPIVGIVAWNVLSWMQLSIKRRDPLCSIMPYIAPQESAWTPEFPMRNWKIGTCAGDPSYLAGVQGHDFQHQHSQKTNCRKQPLVFKPNKCCSFQISETLLPPSPLKTNIKNHSVYSFHRENLQFLQVTNSRP